VKWWSMCERTGHLAHCRHSQCKVVVIKGGDGDGEGGGRRKKVVFVFGYELCLYLVTSCVHIWL
jgi:hypothetical protein